VPPFSRLKSGLATSASALPKGVVSVAVGLFVNGLTAYGFLVISARALGPERYGALSAMWALLFLLGPGLFLPVEQEVARALAARRARGTGAGPLIARAGLAAAGVAAVLAAAIALAAPGVLGRLFDHQALLAMGLALGLVGYSVQHLVRGGLAGSGSFRAYGFILGTEGTIRLVVGAVLAVAGVAVAGPYGLTVGLVPYISTLIAYPARRTFVQPGPEAPWAEVSSALGFLLTASLLSQVLINVGPVAVKLMAPPGDQAAAGRFLAALVISRVPAFMFQAVQAALLPRLSGLAASSDHVDFRSRLGKLLVVVVGLGIVSTLGVTLLGPTIVGLLFGAEFELARRDFAFLGGACAAYMLAMAISQALIALSSHARAALGWAAGVAIFILVAALGEGLLLRIEAGFLAGAMTAAAGLGVLLIGRLPAPREAAPRRGRPLS
jgi:O-antigen/teichoic acid export membrane protein